MPVLKENKGDLSCLVQPGMAEMKALAMHCLIKVSDLGHIFAPTHVHQRWARRLEQEFLLQGDSERELGWEISMFMDRSKPEAVVTKTQDGFFKFVITPLFEAWAGCFPGCSSIVSQAEENRLSWKSPTARGTSWFRSYL